MISLQQSRHPHVNKYQIFVLYLHHPPAHPFHSLELTTQILPQLYMNLSTFLSLLQEIPNFSWAFLTYVPYIHLNFQESKKSELFFNFLCFPGFVIFTCVIWNGSFAYVVMKFQINVMLSWELSLCFVS